MSKQPGRRRLTVWERPSTSQPRTKRRWSAPVLPSASLIQPGYTNLAPRPPRPLRAPAYPLSSRPLLSQQATQRYTFLDDTSSLQTSEQESPKQDPPKQTSQPRNKLRTRVRRISRLFRLSRRDDDAPAKANPPNPASPPTIVPPSLPAPGTSPVALENPRPAPLPPSALTLNTLPQTSPLIPPLRAHTIHAPANRRPLSVPPPLRRGGGPTTGREAGEERWYPPACPSLQLSRFALCQACSRVRHCIAGLGGGRVLCTECVRRHFVDG